MLSFFKRHKLSLTLILLSTFFLTIISPWTILNLFLVKSPWQDNKPNLHEDPIFNTYLSIDAIENIQNISTDPSFGLYHKWRLSSRVERPVPTLRSEIFRHGSRVACWPSTGGIWIKHADLIEMTFLNLPLDEDVPRQAEQEAEDAFCLKLMMVGAERWRFPPCFEDREELGKNQFACDTLEDCFLPDVRNEYLLAWPENTHVVCYAPIKEYESQGERALIAYHNAFNMSRRCWGMIKFGANLCDCKAGCPDLQYLDWGDRDWGSGVCIDGWDDDWKDV